MLSAQPALPRIHAVNDDSAASADAAWRAVAGRLRAEFGEDVFASWFQGILLDRIEDGAAYLTVPTRFLKTWIQAHYADRITALFADATPEISRISIGVRTAAAKVATLSRDVVSAPAPAERPEPRPAAPLALVPRTESNRLTGSPLDRRLTFDTFLVGRSNQLAYAAARQIADARQGDAVTFNPLVIHASVGLGKTHVLQATAHAVEASGRRGVL
ncbi:DnaA ATPase domain-containing protein, partial [Hansschlegelia zhihuaiae]|uniref:DnaA ATPase domain-containing protein n=1 Tax=Hansschlegelia zhihuaiae TaxID=405005 RepID=UPI001FDFBDEA